MLVQSYVFLKHNSTPLFPDYLNYKQVRLCDPRLSTAVRVNKTGRDLDVVVTVITSQATVVKSGGSQYSILGSNC